jgi:hypothetical protein
VKEGGSSVETRGCGINIINSNSIVVVNHSQCRGGDIVLKRILKSLAWGILTKDIYYKSKTYHATHGSAAPLALVKEWKRTSYNAFMADPQWRDRIAYRESTIVFILAIVFVLNIIFAVNY